MRNPFTELRRIILCYQFMKMKYSLINLIKKILFFFVIILYGCKDNYYSRIKSYIDTIKIVDTHEHQLPPGDSANFYFFNTAYFQNDLHNAGATDFDNPVNGKFNIDSFWDKAGKYYNYSRAT